MTRLVLLFIFFLSIPLISEEVEIPDDLIPIEGNSKILFSYEFDDEPRIIERISPTEFLVMMLDDDDAVLYTYNSENNTVEKKSEFKIKSKESLYGYNRKENTLYLYFVISGELTTSYFKTYKEFSWRETAIDLTTYLPISTEIIYTSSSGEKFDIEDINWKIEYASNKIDSSIFLKLPDGLELESDDFKKLNISFNKKDSSKKNFLHLALNSDSNTLYARVSNFDTYQTSPKGSFVKLLDNIESIKNVDVNYTYLDDNSNLYFVLSWIDEELDKMFISLNKITSEGKLTQKIKEMPFEIDEEEYRFKRFEPIYENEDEIKLFGVSRYEGDEDTGLEPVSGLYTITLNPHTMEFDLVSRTLTEDEGKEINTEKAEIFNSYDIEFKFNVISKVIEYDNGYLLLTENSLLQSRSGDRYSSYEHSFDDINLFSLDKDLNFRWNNFIDRDFRRVSWILGMALNSTFWRAKQIVLDPIISDDQISFIYSTTEPEKEIRKATYSMKSGELVSEISYFENYGFPSYFPGFQFPIGNNEFVTLVSVYNHFLVRYKLLK